MLTSFENFADAERLLMVAICSAWESSVSGKFFTPTREEHFYFEGYARGVYVSAISLFPASQIPDSFEDDLEYLITLSAFKTGVAV